MLCPEVLAPAGDFERLVTAVRYGADAVYLGGRAFGMRAASANFDVAQLKQAADLLHAQNKRLYLTCNTLPRNHELEQLPGFLRSASEAGVDALIVTDIGVLQMAKRIVPEMELHISTQAGVVNYLTARELYEMGAKRVVLARELSLEEIREIREKTPPELEIEAFVHGAMCVSFSGRCLLSQYMINRDANRGECAQPCRWNYYLMEEKRPGQYFKLEEDDQGSYILNAKDLCMIEHIDDLARAGITSLKIEGRAKSAYYVAVITNAYRQAVDSYLAHPEGWKLEPWLADEVRKVSHRQYSTGFYYGPPDPGQYYENGGYVRSYDVVAVVERCENGFWHCSQRNYFQEGDELEVLLPGKKPFSITVSGMLDVDGAPLTVANHPMMNLRLPNCCLVPQGTILRKGKAMPAE